MATDRLVLSKLPKDLLAHARIRVNLGHMSGINVVNHSHAKIQRRRPLQNLNRPVNAAGEIFLFGAVLQTCVKHLGNASTWNLNSRLKKKGPHASRSTKAKRFLLRQEMTVTLCPRFMRPRATGHKKLTSPEALVSETFARRYRYSTALELAT